MTDPRLTAERIADVRAWLAEINADAVDDQWPDDPADAHQDTILALIEERETREAARDEADRIACKVFAEQGDDRRELAKLRAENELLRAVAEAARDMSCAYDPTDEEREDEDRGGEDGGGRWNAAWDRIDDGLRALDAWKAGQP